MLRISKLTDYAVLLTTHMAALPDREPRAVPDLARGTGVPQPTVSKVLKRLAREGVVESQRGAQGGYRLARAPADITIAEVIVALEGPIGVTECASEEGAGACDYEGRCDVQGNWRRISAAIHDALERIHLSDMVAGEHGLIPLGRGPRPLSPSGEAGHTPTRGAPT